ncbi:hypothetical protein ALO95_200405 [Pseudomonas syringae pv. antirrhini]|nr:hypothetical protein ALQ23_200315 [Pseudomonas syringae pv. antirrhini]RMW23504.1 hypothetical protein ALO95_200405 [Pseudomonas syringae pv. antirrhini]
MKSVPGRISGSVLSIKVDEILQLPKDAPSAFAYPPLNYRVLWFIKDQLLPSSRPNVSIYTYASFVIRTIHST